LRNILKLSELCKPMQKNYNRNETIKALRDMKTISVLKRGKLEEDASIFYLQQNTLDELASIGLTMGI